MKKLTQHQLLEFLTDATSLIKDNSQGNLIQILNEVAVSGTAPTPTPSLSATPTPSLSATPTSTTTSTPSAAPLPNQTSSTTSTPNPKKKRWSIGKRMIELGKKAFPETTKLVNQVKGVVQDIRGIPLEDRGQKIQRQGNVSRNTKQPTQPEKSRMLSVLQNAGFRTTGNVSAHYVGLSRRGLPIYAFETRDGSNNMIIKVVQTDGTIIQ
jgi:hypothetical protein